MRRLDGGLAPESGGAEQSGVAKRIEHDIDIIEPFPFLVAPRA